MDRKIIATSRVVVQPTKEPLTLADVREHLRLNTFDLPPSNEEDGWILAQIPAVREWCENFLGLSLAPQTREWVSDRWLAPIELPFGPVRSVETVGYVDAAGSNQTVAGFRHHDGVLMPAYGSAWPSALLGPGAVRIRYVAGYDALGDEPVMYPMPRSMRSAMLLLIGHLFENRESTSTLKVEEIPMGVESLLTPYRHRLSMA